MTPRLPLPAPEAMSPEQRHIHDRIVAGPRGRVIGPLRAVLLVPALADSWEKMGRHLRYDSSLPPRASELAILAAARHWNSQLEWQIHAAEAAAAGLPPAIIEAIRTGAAPRFDEADDAGIYDYARRLLADGDVDDELHARLLARWGAAGMVELTALIGYYSMVAMMLNAQAIPLPDGGEPLLPVPCGGPCRGAHGVLPAAS